MAVEEFSNTIELGTTPTWSYYGMSNDLQLGEVMPPGGEFDQFVANKAWHVPTAQWVRWLTIDPDVGGQQYPGPGTFGECTDFRLEVVTYQPVE